MDDLHKRCLLYGVAGTALAGLIYGGFVHRAEADVGTLLGAVNIQLRLAHGMPANDKDGRPLSERAAMIADAWDKLQCVERQQPGLAVTAEFLGFAQNLRGEFAAAAASYRRARSCQDVQREQRDVLVFNEARMLAAAGQQQQALALFAEHGSSLAASLQASRLVEEAGWLRELGRDHEAIARLQQVVADDAAPPMAWLQAGLQFEQLALPERAIAAWERAQAQIPIADYHCARLKLQSGQVENVFELLARACAAAPAEVRRKLREDAPVWQVLAGDARFQELSSPGLAAPSGR